MAIKLYAEGGGKGTYGRFQEGLRSFLKKAGVAEGTFEIVACGSRHDAHKRYCIDIEHGVSALLLVDSEAPVDDSCQSGDSCSWLPWCHLDSLDDGNRLASPKGSCDLDCHLMVQATESWFIADIDTLKKYFQKNFQASAISKNSNPESVDKNEVIRSLEVASSKCSKKYKIGKHTFNLLKEINPSKVVNAMPWAKRFVDHVTELKRA